MDCISFADQSADTPITLRRLCAEKNCVLLETFLNSAAATLREEDQRLPRFQRVEIPSFEVFENLTEEYYQGHIRDVRIESALAVVAQLGEYIWYKAEEKQGKGSGCSDIVVGVDTGLLSVAAVAGADSISDLLALALVAVRVAFRTGCMVRNVESDLNYIASTRACTSTRPRSTVVPNSAGQDSAVRNAKLSPRPPEDHISGSSADVGERSSLPVLGAPGLGAYADYASQVYPNDVIETVIGPAVCAALGRRLLVSTSQVLVPSTGEILEAEDVLELFRHVVRTALFEPVRHDRILDGVVSLARKHFEAGTECRLLCFGASDLDKSLSSALTATGITLHSRPPPSWQARPGDALPQARNEKIAIIGMSGRFPGGANDHEALWKLLSEGLDVHREVPPDRFDVKKHVDPSGRGKNKTHTPYGCFIDQPGLFDPRFFNMSPREAMQTDPMARLALVTAHEALEMAGFVPNRTASSRLERIGTFYGQTSDDWREINAAEDIDTYFITGGVRAFACGRINYHFGFSGPSFSIDTACSSSMAAVQLACTSLWAGDCDMAVTGGLNVLTNPDIFAGLSKGQFLSKTGSCRTYDDDADGYCRGDGCASVILKRYSDAIKDKDPILGCILGAGTNHSADAISITHPHAPTQEALFKHVLVDSGITDPYDISYVEMHGTGTQAGDAVEMTSVTNVFAPLGRKPRSSLQKLHLGAIKRNIGHGEAASGICSLIKILMMFQKDTIPPNVGIRRLNRNFPADLSERNISIPTSAVKWPHDGAPRRVFLNNFSAAGGNTSIVIEDAPSRGVQSLSVQDPRMWHFIFCSGRSIASVKQNARNLLRWSSANSTARLADLSYTLSARRIHYEYRIAVSSSSLEHARDLIQCQIDASHKPVSSKLQKIAFVFAGQGSQYQGVGKRLYETHPLFKDNLERLDRLAKLQGFSSFLPLVDGHTELQQMSPVVVQLGLLCVQIALARLWISWDILPSCVIGHSLGEYAALHVAGILSARDAIAIVGRRAQLLESRCTPYSHGMLAIKGSADTIRGKAFVDERGIQVACINGPDDTVVSGKIEDLVQFNEHLLSTGYRTKSLDVPFAFHSAQIDPIMDDFRFAATGVTFSRPQIPVLSPLLCKVIDQDATATICLEYLARHARETVDFFGALRSAKDEQIIDHKTIWIDIGAHPTSSGMIRSAIPDSLTVASLRKDEDPWKTLSTSLCRLFMAGCNVNFDEVHSPFKDNLELCNVPRYAFDNKNYWLHYHNDWTLTKGEGLTLEKEPTSNPVKHVSKFLSTSCQVIKVENIDSFAGTAKLVVQSDITEPKLSGVVLGHRLNGTPLCPSSLYADMAMTVSQYMYKQLKPDFVEDVGFNICQMDVHTPFVGRTPAPAEGQHLQLEATLNLASRQVQLVYHQVDANGQPFQELGKGLVRVEAINKWKAEWDRVRFMVQSQIEFLREKMSTGGAHKILRGMAYKLFSSLVAYDAPFRGMEEVILHSTRPEATARVRFQTTDELGSFFCSPYWIDSLAHISGFTVNATDFIDNSSVFVSHGWSSIRISKALSSASEYISYVRMLPQKEKDVMAGDVYVLENDIIVAVVIGLKFKKVSRRAFEIMVPPPQTATATERPKPAKIDTAMVVPKLASLQPPPSRSEAAPSTLIDAHGVAQAESMVEALMSMKVMDIVAQETDLDLTELVDGAAFENLGVDSLMTLSISAKLREDLGLDVGSSLFTDYATVGELRRFIDGTYSLSASATPNGTFDDSDNHEEVDSATTYDSDHGSVQFADLASTSRPEPPFGVKLGEYDELFCQFPPVQKPQSSTDQRLQGQLEIAHFPPASSVLLQGNARSATRKLFLLPDGSGSATSYVSIPPLDPDVAVYGLNCPFLRTPDSLVCSVETLTRLYIREMQRRQPAGSAPYLIGGWSAGGVLAYEAARQLILAGETVAHLFLIDSPCPVALDPLPAKLHVFFDQIGLLGTGKPGGTPSWLLPHFAATIAMLDKYEPVPLPPGTSPPTLAIWCTDGVAPSPNDPRPPNEGDQDDPAPMLWLLNNRSDFGNNGWAQLLDEAKMNFAILGGHHFSMMKGDHAVTLGNIIRETLQKIPRGMLDRCPDLEYVS